MRLSQLLDHTHSAGSSTNEEGRSYRPGELEKSGLPSEVGVSETFRVVFLSEGVLRLGRHCYVPETIEREAREGKACQ